MKTERCEIDALIDNRKVYLYAAEALEAGKLVAIPTETVYGLGADALNAAAVARVFEVKERPSFDPLILHIHQAKELERYAVVEPVFEGMINTITKLFWPGPLTLVLPKTDLVPDIVTSGLDTVAVRVSAHSAMRGVCKALGRAIAAPSANKFGRISPTSATAVEKELGGQIDLILDAGACSEGIESTIVRPVLDEKGRPALELLREGPITREQFRKIAKIVKPKYQSPEAIQAEQDKPLAPGQMKSHYAPQKRLQIVEPEAVFVPTAGVRYGLLTFEGTSPLAAQDCWSSVVSLSPGSGRLAEAGVRLFAMMRQMDESTEFDEIVAEAIPTHGLGAAIMDRLRRASV